MAGAAERKKQVRFARLEDDGGGEDGSEDGAEKKEPVAAGPAPGRQSLRGAARVILQPGVTVADGRGRGSPAVAAGAGGGGREAAALRALKWCVSAALCAAFLGLGMAIAILGPTFQDLAENVNKNVSQISYIFVGRSFGYFSGSLLGGILTDCMNVQLLLGLSMLGTTMGLYAIPWCKKALLLTAMMSVIGFSMGVLDTGGNVLALDTWGSEAGPHMQALHFSFALGAVVAPILAKLALGGRVTGPQAHPSGSDDNQSSVNSLSSPPSSLKLHLTLNFVWSYVVIGTYLLLVAVFFFILYLKSSAVRDRVKLSTKTFKTAKYHKALILLLSFFFLCYVGAEVTYGSYIFTYAKTYVAMTENEAAGLNTVFWGTFATCRGLAICFAACSYPGTMILLSVICSTVSSLFLALFSKHPVSLWLGSAVYGASMATIFPSGISWIEQYTTIQGKSAALFVMGAALGEMCIPAVVGLLQGYYPALPVLMYSALGAASMTAVLFPVLYKLATSPCDAKRKDVGDSELQEALLSNSHVEEDDEGDNEDGREWNDVDFEVIEMNDTLQNSVIETSKKIQGQSVLTTSSPHASENVSCNSPVLASVSPRGKSSSKND
uniref:Sodium-dependent glucose transporter 1 n=1 Tax=Pogona vitticeps TaxID=103695 RepID=A0ABM5G869_9SAUR